MRIIIIISILILSFMLIGCEQITTVTTKVKDKVVSESNNCEEIISTLDLPDKLYYISYGIVSDGKFYSDFNIKTGKNKVFDLYQIREGFRRCESREGVGENINWVYCPSQYTIPQKVDNEGFIIEEEIIISFLTILGKQKVIGQIKPDLSAPDDVIEIDFIGIECLK